MSTHTRVEVDIFASSDCRDEDCEHIEGCPTIRMVVCLECNAVEQGTDDASEWGGNVAACPIYGTGTPRDQADVLISALTSRAAILEEAAATIPAFDEPENPYEYEPYAVDNRDDIRDEAVNRGWAMGAWQARQEAARTIRALADTDQGESA